MQQLFSFSGLFNALLSIVFGLVVLYKDRRSRVNQVFFLITFATAFWSFGYWQWLRIYSGYGAALFWVRFLTIGSFFMPIFYFHWVTELIQKKFNKIIFFGYLLTFVYSSFIFSEKLIAVLRPQSFFPFWPMAGPVYSAFLVTNYLGLFLGGSLLLLFNYRKAHGLKRMQLLYALVGALIAIGGGTTNFFLWYGIKVPPFGNFFVAFYVIFFGISIIKFRFMNIRTIASKLFVYLLISVFAYSFFYVTVFFEELLFGSIFALEALLFAPLAAVIFAALFIPFFKKVQKSSDVIFFHGYHPQSIIKNLGLKLSGVINLDELLKIIAAEFKKILATDEIDIYLFKKEGKEGREVCVSIMKPRSKIIHGDNAICRTIRMSKKILARDELEREGRKRLVEELDLAKAKIIAPLILRHHVVGVIFLGEKMDQGAYTKEDFDFLEIISSQAAVAIENALLYKEVDDFNKTLQEKVDEQTRELSTKAEHLKKLMEMRSEFLDITSHQLRTPVSVIKGVLSMLEEGSIPEEKKKLFIAGALEKSIKLGEIINDILRASEMDTDKFTLHLKSVDLNEMMKKIKDDKSRTAEVKKVALRFELPAAPLPPVFSDDRYLEQAIVNLINNSFQYTLDGSITVSAEVRPKEVVIRVADTGIGIPEEAIPKLFQKFGRAENAVVTYTDGSGLGLYIIKEIVDANPGAKIEIERTEVGKGTTFALTLPIFSEKLLTKTAARSVAKPKK